MQDPPARVDVGADGITTGNIGRGRGGREGGMGRKGGREGGRKGAKGQKSGRWTRRESREEKAASSLDSVVQGARRGEGKEEEVVRFLFVISLLFVV